MVGDKMLNLTDLYKNFQPYVYFNGEEIYLVTECNIWIVVESVTAEKGRTMSANKLVINIHILGNIKSLPTQFTFF